MTTYAIGDIQGCAAALDDLLIKINFNPASDHLWFAGDIINRGPESLRSLQIVKDLQQGAIMVLGNHDFHLLMVLAGFRKTAAKDTLDDILNSKDRDSWFDWLRHQPLLHRDSSLGYTMTHAGIYPLWDIQQAMDLANEVEAALKGPHHREFLHALPGKCPPKWHDDLTGIERLRFITSAFTRMRYCRKDGALEFEYKGAIKDAPAKLLPWYQVETRIAQPDKLLFGHWASHGESDTEGVIPLDFGCVWGGKMRAMALETGQPIDVNCSDTGGCR